MQKIKKDSLCVHCDVTKVMREIFGNDVIKSAIAVQSHGYTKNQIKDMTQDKSIDYSGDTIYAELKNGRVIRFSNSEWADMTRMTSMED